MKLNNITNSNGKKYNVNKNKVPKIKEINNTNNNLIKLLKYCMFQKVFNYF